MAEEKNASTAKDSQAAGASRVEWDDSKMITSYANVANAASTREEVALLFGTNTTWKISGDKPVKIELNNRIILSPFAAKRLNLLLSSVLDEYESRFGKLDVEPPEKASGKQA
ncbi:MAG: DUF3467 domain-containing protein [Gammaproteobacteria bacterium]|jgi:hypothetical protein